MSLSTLLRKDGDVSVRPEPFDSPFVLSLSKDERFAQDRPVEGRTSGSWFDKLTTNGNAAVFGKLST
jgi:hypothetical protein